MIARSRAHERAVAALGVRSHSGWASYVVLAGSAKRPDIVERGRMQLCDASVAGAKQPFHEAEQMPFTRAEKFIAERAASTAALAERAIAEINAKTNIKTCCVLTASGLPLPDLRSILASHARIHTAEGEFYRDAIAWACAARSIAVKRVRERDIETELEKLPVLAAAAKARITEFGKQMGSPWTQDEKLAACGAWLMLAFSPERR